MEFSFQQKRHEEANNGFEMVEEERRKCSQG
jgi:hypothetical protein